MKSYKLALPSVEAAWRRDRSLQALSGALSHQPLVWMLGLPGAGKTTLAAQWVRQAQGAGRTCIWYRLDEDDEDIAALFDALRQTAGAADLPAWSPAHGTEPERFARQFFAQWLEAHPSGLTLVLDDCHRLGAGSGFFGVVDAVVDLARSSDGRLSLLMLSRRAPPAPLARGQVAGWLTVFDQLSLTPEEVAAVVRHVSGRTLSSAEARSLDAAEGWMAHVLALTRQGGAVADAARGSVGEFLCEELLRLLPVAERRPLRLAAELPELPRDCVPLAPATCRLLEELAAQRYFVEPLPTGWRLHDLLRDGLCALNAQLEPPAELAAARRMAAGWVAEAMPEVAMHLLVAAGDVEAVQTLLDREGQRWLAQGRHRQLIAWLGALPDPAPAAREIWRAEALLPLAPEEARPVFARCRAAAVATTQPEAAWRAWCGEVASYVVQWGAVQGLAELVDELEAMAATLGPPAGEWQLRCAADALTALMYGRAEDPRIRHYAEATARNMLLSLDAAARIGAAAQLLIYKLWWAGDFPGGRALYDAYESEVERGHADGSLPALARLLWWSNAAIVDWQCGDPARCYAKVEQGLALAQSSGIHLRDFFLLTQGIFCALSQEDWPRAEAWLAQLAHTERGHRRLDSMVHHFFRSWHALSRGDAALALAHAETALPMAEALGSLFHRVIVLSALAPARLHNGDLAGAAEAYRMQLALAKGSQNPTFAYIAFCAGAEIALVAGDREALRKQVERMLTVKHLGGFHSDCGWRSPVRARLMAFALEAGVLPEVARQWIRQKRLSPPEGFTGDWPVPVRIKALQGLEVELDEPGDTGGAKPAARLRELLAALVARHPQGVQQAELQDWLWPDAEGDKAAASLKVAVHRLRAWLGHESVLLRQGVLSLNPQRVSCDLWQARARDPAGLAAGADAVLAGLDLPPVQQLRQQLARPHPRESGGR